MASSSRFSEVEEEKITDIIDATIPKNVFSNFKILGH